MTYHPLNPNYLLLTPISLQVLTSKAYKVNMLTYPNS
jgi:hypothetical protein